MIPRRFELTNLKTTRPVGLNGLASQIFDDPSVVQNLSYVYDPVGNITRIADAALKTVFNANQQVDSASDYIYDPLYRLIQATGREHVGQSAFAFAPPDGNYRDYPFAGATQQSDLQALRNYTEVYAYDPVGNFLTMAHQAVDGNWTRAYAYNEVSLTEPGKQSNRLSQTALQTGVNPPVEPYSYDGHGNMTRMPHLPMMKWNYRDQLSATSRQIVSAGAAATTYYVYDAAGQRGRKITESQNGARKNERFYLGGFEVYREYGSASAPSLERQTLHVMDDKQRTALIETQTIGSGAGGPSTNPTQRYQLGNHLGSASLELDGAGGLISFEGYSPYGNTCYQSGRSAAEISLKRYRYTGKERDEENGFTYHSARYFAPWLGRWTSCDPLGIADGLSTYVYVGNVPTRQIDDQGMSGVEFELGSQSRVTASRERLMAATDRMVGVMQGELRSYFGIATQIDRTYETRVNNNVATAPSRGPLVSVKLSLSDKDAQTKAREELKGKIELDVRTKFAGQSEQAISTEVNVRMDRIDTVRNFVMDRLKETFAYSVKVENIMADPKQSGKILTGMATVRGFWSSSLQVNPFTWFKQDGNDYVESLTGTGKGKAALGPTLQFIHELEHYNKEFIAGDFPKGAEYDPGFDEEEEVVKDIDKFVKDHPDIAERSWYGSSQSNPGDRYVLGSGGSAVGQASSDPTDKDFVRWPSEQVLKQGQ